MEEEDLLLEEKVRARKRTILLVLLFLLLGVAVTAVLLEPPPAALPTVAEVKPPPTPSRVVTPIETVMTRTPTPQEARDDQQTESPPTSAIPASQTPATKVSTAAQNVPNEASTETAQEDTTAEPEPTGTPVQSTASDRETPPGALAAADEIEIPSSTDDSTAESATPTVEIKTPDTPTTENSALVETTAAATKTVQDTTPVARITPAVSIGNEEDSAVPATAVATGSTNSLVSDSSTPQSTVSLGDLPRVHELWDSSKLHLPSADNDEAPNVTPNTETSSELAETAPPDGLPVTGVFTPPKMNWAAVIMLVVLLGAGVMAVWYPNRK